MAYQYPQILDLDELNVYREDEYNSLFFDVKNLPELLQRGYRKRLRKYGVPTDEKFGPGVINPYDYMEKKKKKRYYYVYILSLQILGLVSETTY